MSAGIRVLKLASAYEKGGQAVAKALRAAAKGSVDLVRGGATVGGGIAKGFGASPTAGKVLGGGAVAGGGVLGVKELDEKRRRWLYQHNFGRY